MHHWKTAFLTLLIFGLGGVAGGLITAQVIKGKIERVKQTTPGPEVAGLDWIPQSVQAMHRQLNLSPDQVERAREIMGRAQREIVRAREDLRLRSRNAIANADEDILAILNGDQKARFEEFKNKRRQQRARNALRPNERERGDMPPGRPQNQSNQPRPAPPSMPPAPAPESAPAQP